MLSRMEQLGGAMVADSPDEVRVRTREQLMQGASQIKLTAGGGVSSPFSPVDVTTFTEAELRAAVEAAENWGTYVATHAFTPAAIQRSIAAGVKVIEHGMLMDEATAKLMAEKGIWLSMQPIPEALVLGFPVGSVQRAKAEEVWSGIGTTYELAKKYKLKTAWGTDVLFSRALAQQQGAILASLTRWYTPAEALIMATSTNAELLALSGKRNPYPGKLGVVEEGALADLLLVDGDPIANIKLIEDPAKNFVLIMKDGKIYKNIARPEVQCGGHRKIASPLGPKSLPANWRRYTLAGLGAIGLRCVASYVRGFRKKSVRPVRSIATNSEEAPSEERGVERSYSVPGLAAGAAFSPLTQFIKLSDDRHSPSAWPDRLWDTGSGKRRYLGGLLGHFVASGCFQSRYSATAMATDAPMTVVTRQLDRKPRSHKTRHQSGASCPCWAKCVDCDVSHELLHAQSYHSQASRCQGRDAEYGAMVAAVGGSDVNG